MMILLQQRKIAALDEANNRLLGELSRLGDRVGYSRAGVQASKRSVGRCLNCVMFIILFVLGRFKRHLRQWTSCLIHWTVSVTLESEKLF